MNGFNLAKLSMRERRLILLAMLVVVLALFFLWQRTFNEVRQMREDVYRAQISAEARAARGIRPTQPAGQAASAVTSLEDARAPLLDGLSRHGLILSTMNSNEAGKIAIELDEASPSALFLWIDETKRLTGLEPSAVQIDARDDGQVRAAIVFSVDAA